MGEVADDGWQQAARDDDEGAEHQTEDERLRHPLGQKVKERERRCLHADREPRLTAFGTSVLVRADNFLERAKVETQLHQVHLDGTGGTVLLGGIKRLNEERREYGVPILDKIPYLNRLFKNVGIGRECSSLMMMVTPRIIIQEEEEFQQTGYDSAAP